MTRDDGRNCVRELAEFDHFVDLTDMISGSLSHGLTIFPTSGIWSKEGNYPLKDVREDVMSSSRPLVDDRVRDG